MPANRTLDVAVIGAGKMALDCLARILDHGGARPGLVISPASDDMAGRRLAGWCASHAVPLHHAVDPNDAMCLDRLGRLAPAAIFNINSFAILRRPLLAIPRLGVVNFHNGPLPAYAGMNIPTWAIWNGEREHGVSWHLVDEGVDTGDVIAQTRFPLDPRETAATLTMKCIVAGIRMFDGVLDAVLSGDPPRMPQAGRRTCYRKADVPNAGRLDLTWPSARIEQLIRALDFHPFPSPLGAPQVRLANGMIGLGRVEFTAVADSDAACAPGTIERIEADRLTVRTGDGRLVIRSFVSPDGETLGVATVARQHALAPGTVLG